MDFLTDAARFLDPTSLALVAGGTILAAALRSTREDLARALAALRPLVRSRPARDALEGARALRAAALLAEHKGVVAADRVETANAFARRAALVLADAPSAGAFASWAKAELDGRARRHAAAIGVWRAAADAAPAAGMIGTVVGLIGMFATMEDASAIGSFIALAMLTTLYGLVIGSAICGPVAARLERLSAAEREWQSDLLDGLTALALADGGGAWRPARARLGA